LATQDSVSLLPTGPKEVDPSTLYILFWKAVFWLLKRGINITYCCCDGGESNRSFIKIHFGDKDPAEENVSVVNPYTREPMIFILDFSVIYFYMYCIYL
jgi:hypothetical protein